MTRAAGREPLKSAVKPLAELTPSCHLIGLYWSHIATSAAILIATPQLLTTQPACYYYVIDTPIRLWTEAIPRQVSGGTSYNQAEKPGIAAGWPSRSEWDWLAEAEIAPASTATVSRKPSLREVAGRQVDTCRSSPRDRGPGTVARRTSSIPAAGAAFLYRER